MRIMAQSLGAEYRYGHAHAVAAKSTRLMIRVGVSILNYNSAQSTIACVRSLLGANQKKGGACLLEVLVADNASREDDRRHLQQSLADLLEVHIQLNSENLGFAAGHNRNLAAIFHHSAPDYVWILNSDCLVSESTLPSLIESAIRHTEVGIWGATLLELDDKTIQCAGGCFYNPWISSYRQFGQGNSLQYIDQLEPVDYDYIAGASLFFPVATLQEGLHSVPMLPAEGSVNMPQWLNESFFLYFEELDLAQRLKPGFGMAWCKGALIRHAGGESTGTVDSKRTELAEYHSTLSALKFTRLYYPQRLWFMAPARYFSKCLLLFLRREFHLIGVVTRAYLEFWRIYF